MLAKAQRLNSQEVESAMRKGRRSSTGLFSLYRLEGVSGGKIAIIIPKKVAKTSVLRHRHKRRIMSALRKITLPKDHLIITLRQDISRLDFTTLCEEVTTLLQ